VNSFRGLTRTSAPMSKSKARVSFTPFHGQVDYAASRRELKANSHSMGLP
jgi:hypothetical protein